MNDKQIIIVSKISKIYSLHKKTSLRARTARIIGSGRKDALASRFYALQDISFCVNQGEGVAIFGRNGSGKTTLLQLLASVMNPSSGSILVDGRFTALLGATMGLMPTMTGLENIHLLAAMYGIRLDQHLDLLQEIINFADIGDFINTYVKNYSSGMKARIGFSVAIHVLPEIVFIDEVLAVGDVHYRQKCTNKIIQLRKDGRTFIIVAHNPKSVEDLCDRAIWLDNGQLMLDAGLQETWSEYFTFKRALESYS